MKDLLRLMLERGADPNQKDKMGNTALIAAAMACDGEVLQMLLDAGADPHAKNTSGLTALEFTFMFANPGAEVLLKAGAKIPPEKVGGYLQAYGKNPAAAKLIKKAAENR
jgi:ankyrin repeat protein